MKSVDDMIVDVLRREGGFSRDPDDPGHQLRVSQGDRYDSFCTNYGVTQYTLSHYRGRQATVAEVQGLTPEQAAEIYQTEYLVKPQIHRLDLALQPVMFDMSINHGPKRAIKILQSVCVKAGYSLAIDGKIGLRTLEQSSLCYGALLGWMVNAMVEERVKFYKRLIARRPSLSKFRSGWIRRANEFLVPDAGEYIAAALINTMGVTV